MNRHSVAYARILRWAPVAIFLLTVGVRGFLLARQPRELILYGEAKSGGAASLDEGINVARSLVATRSFADPFATPTGPTAHVPPSYPVTTAVIFLIFGTGLAGAVARNVLNIAGYGVLYAAAPSAATALRMGRPVGIIAGFMAAIYPACRSTEVFRGRDEWLGAFILLWLTAIAFRFSGEPRWGWRSTLVYALGWGELMYINPSTVVVLPLHLLIAIVTHKQECLRTRLKHAGVVVFTMFLVILPWIVRNRITLGGWFFMRDNLGLELMVANGEGSQPSQAANQGTRWYWYTHPMGSPEAVRRIQRSGELEFNRRALGAAAGWIMSHPDRFAWLTLRRFAFFWMDMPSNWLTFFLRGVLSVLCWVGIFIMWRERMFRQVALLAAILLAYPIAYYFVQYSNRYVATLLFALFLPSAYTLRTFMQFYLTAPAWLWFSKKRQVPRAQSLDTQCR